MNVLMVILLAPYFQTRPKIGKKIRAVFCVHISIKSYRRFEDQCFPLRVGEIDIHNHSHRVTPLVQKVKDEMKLSFFGVYKCYSWIF